MTGKEQAEKMNRERDVGFKERKELRSWDLPLGSYQTLGNCETGPDPFYGSENATPKHYIHLVWMTGTNRYFAVHGFKDERFPEFFRRPENAHLPVVKYEPKKMVSE
ncbi:MAG: hypothetical protein Q7K40_01585 [bacterium]|nr:hypothetical protein [bacterium]